jgi:hypothetical protein
MLVVDHTRINVSVNAPVRGGRLSFHKDIKGIVPFPIGQESLVQVGSKTTWVKSSILLTRIVGNKTFFVLLIDTQTIPFHDEEQDPVEVVFDRFLKDVNQHGWQR